MLGLLIAYDPLKLLKSFKQVTALLNELPTLQLVRTS
jgi:hypothetical protein